MEKLEKQAIELLQMMCGSTGCVISDSGGKDSSVLKHIALKAHEIYGLPFSVRHIDIWTTGKKVFKWWMEDENLDGQLAFDIDGNIYEEYL